MSRSPLRRTTQRLINDPSFAFGRVYEPFDVVESNIVLLQAKLSTLPKTALTIPYLESEYTSLLDRLENSGETVVTAYATHRAHGRMADVPVVAYREVPRGRGVG